MKAALGAAYWACCGEAVATRDTCGRVSARVEGLKPRVGGPAGASSAFGCLDSQGLGHVLRGLEGVWATPWESLIQLYLEMV